MREFPAQKSMVKVIKPQKWPPRNVHAASQCTGHLSKRFAKIKNTGWAKK